VIRPLNPASLPPAVREANERRMAAFIGLALRERVGLDKRKSVVLYDQNFVFNFALDELPNERVLRALYDRTPVRYWSRGV
jgi:hypothetical protein